MGGVILTSAAFWHALVATRCLGRRGIKVACGEQRQLPRYFFQPASSSRYCSERFTYPGYETDPEGFIGAICEFANRHREYDVLMPVYEETQVISRHIDAIRSAAPHLKVPVHDYESIRMAADKRRMAALARRIGVPVPTTYFPDSVEEAEGLAGRVRYPAVIKIPSGEGGKGMAQVRNREEAVSAYRDTVARYRPGPGGLPFIQEYVPGTDYLAAGLFHHGEPRAGIVARSIRNLPPGGGLMVVRVSVVQQQMAGYLEALAAEMKWHGVIMADFRLDERDDTPRLLDVNPRLWGSLYQAVASGVEFPYLLYRMALDGDISPVPAYEAGVRTRCLWNDTKALPAYLRQPGSRLRTMREFLDFRATKYDDISIRDPLPVIAMVLNIPIRLAVRPARGDGPRRPARRGRLVNSGEVMRNVQGRP